MRTLRRSRVSSAKQTSPIPPAPVWEAIRWRAIWVGVIQPVSSSQRGGVGGLITTIRTTFQSAHLRAFQVTVKPAASPGERNSESGSRCPQRRHHARRRSPLKTVAPTFNHLPETPSPAQDRCMGLPQRLKSPKAHLLRFDRQSESHGGPTGSRSRDPLVVAIGEAAFKVRLYGD